MKQHTFASLDYARQKKQTRREQFLSEMARCMPWRALLALSTCLRQAGRHPQIPPSRPPAADLVTGQYPPH